MPHWWGKQQYSHKLDVITFDMKWYKNDQWPCRNNILDVHYIVVDRCHVMMTSLACLAGSQRKASATWWSIASSTSGRRRSPSSWARARASASRWSASTWATCRKTSTRRCSSKYSRIPGYSRYSLPGTSVYLSYSVCNIVNLNRLLSASLTHNPIPPHRTWKLWSINRDRVTNRINWSIESIRGVNACLIQFMLPLMELWPYCSWDSVIRRPRTRLA